MATPTKYKYKTPKGVQERLGQPGTQRGSATGSLNAGMNQPGKATKTDVRASLPRVQSVSERLGQA